MQQSRPEALERGVMFGYSDTWKSKEERDALRRNTYDAVESDPDSLINRVSQLTKYI